MAFSGGTFSRTFDCTTDRDNGVKILASKFDTELDGFATGLSTCILKDGTQTCTAAIPFAEGLTVPDNKTIVLGTNSDITIQYDESTNDSLEIAANVEGAALGIVLKADQGDDNADQHKLNIADGGVLTLGSKISGSFVNYLTHTPNSTVASSTTAVAGNLTVGGDLTLGSGAVISEAELEAIDGVTAGTVAASKAVIVDSNKDIASFRNVTLTGELDAGSLDISGDADIDGTLEADAMTLNGTAITATATLDTGISNNNVPKFTSGVADDDFLRVAGTAIEGRSASEVLSDIGGQASLTFGISDTNAVKIDSSSVADDEYARFTANGLESRATSEVLSDIGAAPAAGSSNIVTTGALNSGSITSGFGSIDNGSSAITTTGVITGGTVEATADTSAGDNAAIGYTATEGLILTGQGSTSDITVKNDADATVFSVPTGTDDILFPDNAKILMGDSSDLQIYHDGENSIIKENSTGDLFLMGTNVQMKNGANSATYLTASSGGAVTAFHNNSAKIATSSSGVDITGGFTATDGCTITTADNSAQLTLVSTDADATSGPELVLRRNSSSPADNDHMGRIKFNFQNDADEEIVGVQFDTRALDVPDGAENGRFNLQTMTSGNLRNRIDVTNDGTVINQEAQSIDTRIESNGYTHMLFVDAGNNSVGIGQSSPGSLKLSTLEVEDRENTKIFSSNGSLSNRILHVGSARGGSSDFIHADFFSSNGGDLEFRARGDGAISADGSFSGGGADYAEYFEWADGNSSDEDRRGYSIVLDGNKIRKATAEDAAASIIGIVSARPVVLGDAAWNHWQGKHERDDFGAVVMEDYSIAEWTEYGEAGDDDATPPITKQHSYHTDRLPEGVTIPDDAKITTGIKRRKESSDYDASITYVPREDRVEWDAVGLMGKLRMKKGQPTGDRWIKLRDISSDVEEWLVR